MHSHRSTLGAASSAVVVRLVAFFVALVGVGTVPLSIIALGVGHLTLPATAITLGVASLAIVVAVLAARRVDPQRG